MLEAATRASQDWISWSIALMEEWVVVDLQALALLEVKTSSGRNLRISPKTRTSDLRLVTLAAVMKDPQLITVSNGSTLSSMVSNSFSGFINSDFLMTIEAELELKVKRIAEVEVHRANMKIR